VLSRAQTKAERISPHQLSAWLETRLREGDDFFRSDSSLHEAGVGDKRLVPLRYEYSILDPVGRAPTTEYDAVRIRVLADDPDTVSDQVETWQNVNDGRDGGEHILIAIDVPRTDARQNSQRHRDGTGAGRGDREPRGTRTGTPD